MGNFCPRFGRQKKNTINSQNVTSSELQTQSDNLLSFTLYSKDLNIQTDCVILTYVGNTNHLLNHPFFQSLKCKNLQKLIKSYKKQVPIHLSVGSACIIENKSQDIKIKQIILIHFPLWVQKRRDFQIYQSLQQMLILSESMGHRNITMSYFSDQLGIPLNIGVRVIISSLLQKHRRRGCKYTIMFEDKKQFDYCLKYASEFTGQISTTSITTDY